MADGVSPTQVQPLLCALPQTQQQEGESQLGAFLLMAMPMLPALTSTGSTAGAWWAGVCPHGHRGFSPSHPQEPGLFEADVVSSQLRYSGILETIRIRKEGFPIRIPFFVFIDRCLGGCGLGTTVPARGGHKASGCFWGAVFGLGGPHSGSWEPPLWCTAPGEAAFPGMVLITMGRVCAGVPVESHVVMVSRSHPGTAASSTCGPMSFPTGPTAWRC